jgi:hypothetical protein
MLIVQGWALVIFVRHGLSALVFPDPLDYGEGPLLDQAVRLADFENIYRADLATPPYVVTNYPPLFELVEVPFVWVFGPAFWYGRAISLASVIAVAVLIALTLHALTKNKIGAAAGGLTFLSIPYVLIWSGFARVDFLGLALSWAGLFIIVRWPERRRAVVIAALLFLAAVYTRQTYIIVAPFAAFFWLLAQGQRRRAGELAGVFWSLGLALFLILNVLTDGGFFFNTVTSNINEFQWEKVFYYVSEMQGVMPYLLLAGGAFWFLPWWWGWVKSWWFVAPYTNGAVLSALLIGKVGSAPNYLLELSVALSLAVGAIVAWHRRRHWLQAALVLILAVQVFGMVQWWSNTHLSYDNSTTDDGPFALWLPDQDAEIERVNEIIQEAKGTVLTDQYMGLLPLNEQRIYYQAFELSQLARNGHWDQRPFLRAIDEGEFAAILIRNDSYWTPEMRERINERYEPAEEVGETVVYRAK